MASGTSRLGGVRPPALCAIAPAEGGSGRIGAARGGAVAPAWIECVAPRKPVSFAHAGHAYLSDPEPLHLASRPGSGLQGIGQLRQRAAGLVRVLADPKILAERSSG